ncbi:Fatty acid synthase [Talaromyces islandicus]|uniref:Fatty acid synthase n=1 Tax=Talaromyces islandicus TaxID=28573 RepID=A0A0U1LSW1_TALIS|nr:Fatty acid synthase [Talaromyces islandicus]
MNSVCDGPHMASAVPDATPADAQGASQYDNYTQQPIAIIGYACRLPGQVSSPNDLWELCTRKRSGWSPIPKDRFSSDAFHHPNASKLGTFNPTGGYFLQDDIAHFDAPFFNITAQEAVSMDPQQRLLLECSYEALESAGIAKESLAGRNVGVFVGGNFADYEINNLRDVETIPMHQPTGCAPSLQSNRISYFFDFRGPSFTVDSACSSSLVAVHAAVQSLRIGESTETLVAGCRLNVLPDLFVSMSMSQLFNDEGKTYAFEERANSGFARGEGAGVVLLKPLDAALRDRDPVRAVIVNSGISQDGRTQGITMPNGDAQEELIRRVYREANIRPEDCGFVEMHGTGTKVGDPIEARAAHAALGAGRSPKNPLYIGSVKSNIGHLEGASGVVALIKAAMMLDNGLLLPNADFKKPNENIPLEKWNMKVVTSTRPWPRGKKYISVSNYGFGGTNAHVILERPPLVVKGAATAEASPKGSLGDPKSKLIVISANDKDSLQARIKDYGIYFEQRPEVFEKTLFGNFAYTLGSKLSHLSYRVALPATSLDELGIRLAQMKIHPSRVLREPRIGFVFTGQGAQWAEMGMSLMNEYPIFASAISRADQCLRHLGAPFSLVEELCKDVMVSEIDSPHLSQPTCTAIQIALVLLLKSWGIRPSSVIGHSSGEIAASFAAGVYDLDCAMSLAYHRGQMTSLLKEKHPNLRGGMIAVGASPEEVSPILKTLRDGYATVACVNSPSSVTVSGDLAAIQELEQILQLKQLFNRRLKIDVAYHSDHMKIIEEAYFESIASIKPRLGSEYVKFYSSVFGKIANHTMLNASYWVQNLTSPVLFPDALSEMFSDNEESPNLLVELGPHSALKGPIMDTLKYLGSTVSKIGYTPTIVRNMNVHESLLNVAATAAGRDNRFLTDIPRYPWQHSTRYWHEPRIAQKHRTRDGAIRNDILGVLANYSNDIEPTWRNIIRLDDIPWLRDHRMQGMVVYPLAGYVVMALEAAKVRAQWRNLSFAAYELREVVVESALILADDVDVETTISLRPYYEGTRGSSDVWDEFKIHSWGSERGWIQHCRGLIKVQSKPGSSGIGVSDHDRYLNDYTISKKKEIEAASVNKIHEQYLYKVLSDLGAHYGRTFQGLENCHADSHHSYADLYIRSTASLMPKGFQPQLSLQPAFLDGLLHLAWPILGQGRMELETLYMPTLIKRATISCSCPSVPGDYVKIHGTGSPHLQSPEPTNFDFFATDNASSETLITVHGLVMTPIRDNGLHQNTAARKLCYKLHWQPLPTVHTNALSFCNEPIVSHIATPFNHNISDITSISETNATADIADFNDIPLNEINNGPANGDMFLAHSPTGNGSGASVVTNGYRHDDKMEIDNALPTPDDNEHIVVTFGLGDNGMITELVKLLNAGASFPRRMDTIKKSECVNRGVIIVQSPTTSLRDMTNAEFNSIQFILLNAESTLWVYDSTSPDSQMTVGLARSVRSESMAKLATLGLRTQDARTASGVISRVLSFMRSNDDTEACPDFEFKFEGSELLVPRAVEDEVSNSFIHKETSDLAIAIQPFHQPGRRFKISIRSPGSLDTLYFADDSASVLDAAFVEVEVKATGINFKDIVVSMGQLSQPYIGVECSGIVTSVGHDVTDVQVGQHVMCMTEGSYSTYARCSSTSVVPVPDCLSLHEAATIPVAFCTAYYGLFDLGRLSTSERVLIHAGAGGVGQAAIQLAQMVGADVFITVGNQEKKEFLMERYHICEDRIFYSRDASFGHAIRNATNNEGVDVILNSLAGDLLRETWECLAPFGRFIEIGKADITKNSRLEMIKFEENVTFSSVDLTKVAKFRPHLMKRLLTDVCKLIDGGSIKPISPITKYSISEVETAFRTLQTGKNIGKAVVISRPNDKVKAVLPKSSSTLLRPDAAYILVGGIGGIGRSMAKWMSSKGARHIVLTSRNATITKEIQKLRDQVAVYGTHIHVKVCDISDSLSVETLVKEGLRDLPPIRGVVHGAMVLRDTLFEQMSLEDFQAVAACKVEGAWNLHYSLANSPLDFFIALSSVAGVIGNRGQAAYSAANVFLDGFMEYRRSQNLPGTAIDLAAVTNAGYLADSDLTRRQEVLKNIGSSTIDESEVLALLALAITGDIAKTPLGQCITGLEINESFDSFWVQDAKFSFLRAAAESNTGNSARGSQDMSLRAVFKSTNSTEEAVEKCYQHLVVKLSDVLGLSPDDMDCSTRVSSLGLDSLVAIEVRNWIAREAEANVQVLELLSSDSLIKLASLILTKSKLWADI